MNDLYGLFKKGNQDPDRTLNPDTNIFMKEGMLVCYHDEEFMGPISQLSEHAKKVFAVVKIPRSYYENVKDWVEPIYGDYELGKGKILIRKRAGVLDLKALASEIGDASLYDKWAGPEAVEPINYNLGDMRSRIIPATNFDYNNLKSIEDFNLITSGVWTIGSGGAYPQVNAFEADMGTPTDELTGRIISDVTETSQANFNVSSNFNVIIDSNTPHNGNQTAGWKISSALTSDVLVFSGGGFGNREMKDFCIQYTGVSNISIINDGYSAAITNFHDLFITSSQTREGLGLEQFGTANKKHYNIVMWNLTKGYDMVGKTSIPKIENMTIYDCASGFDGSAQAFTMENISVLGCSTNYVSCQNATGNNCISSDATIPGLGSNQHINVVINDEVQSTDDTDGNLFLFPKFGGNMADGGKTPQVSLQGMKGTLWDAVSPSIGAFQFVDSAIITAIGITSTEQFSDPNVSSNINIPPNSIVSLESFGNPSIDILRQLFIISINSGESFGSPGVAYGFDQFVEAIGIPSQEYVSNPIVRNLWVLSVLGIDSQEAVGTPSFYLKVLSKFQSYMEQDLENIFFTDLQEFAIPVTYIYSDGSTIPELMVIFDKDYQGIDPDTGVAVQSVGPMITCQTSKFTRRPRKGDKVLIDGVRYKVLTHEPDGTGVSELTLNQEQTV